MMPSRFAAELKTALPLITYEYGQLRSHPREPTVIEFNKYVVDLRLRDLPAAITLSKFCKHVSGYVRRRAQLAREVAAVEVIKRVYGEFRKHRRKRAHKIAINKVV